jgi:hypothetical protein
MQMAGLKWYKEVTTAKSLRTSSHDTSIPRNHFDIAGRDDSKEWIAAEEEEIAQLLAMGTWELVKLPPGRKAIKSKWVYRMKTDPFGNVTRYKARLCACGYSQKAGIDYKEIYAPVFRMESSRLFLIIISSRKMKFVLMDVTGAFLNGGLEERIYMAQPEGYEDLTRAEYVLLLLRNLYGLKQAPRVWHQTIDPFLRRLGFIAMEADPCIYYKWDADRIHLQLISLYVDNLGIAADLQSDIDHVRSQLNSEFKMTDEPDNMFLQMQLSCTDGIYSLSQTNAINKLIIATNMETALPSSTPMETLTLSNSDSPVVGSDEWIYMQTVPYRETIGSLSDICRKTRPDIAYSVSVASRYLANPGKKHWAHVKRIIRYLKGTKDYVLLLDPGSSPLTLYGFTDADWGGELDSSKSTSGYGFFYGKALFSSRSQTQSVTATSSTHAEYIAAYHSAAECIWARSFLQELGLISPNATTIYCDNEAAIKIAHFHMITPRSKHFNTKFHYLREQVINNYIDLQHVKGTNNLADIWTKPLGKLKFTTFCARLGIVPNPVHSVSDVN